MWDERVVDDEPAFVEVGVCGEIAVAPQSLQLHVMEVGDSRVLDVPANVDHLKLR